MKKSNIYPFKNVVYKMSQSFCSDIFVLNNQIFNIKGPDSK